MYFENAIDKADQEEMYDRLHKEESFGEKLLYRAKDIILSDINSEKYYIDDEKYGDRCCELSVYCVDGFQVEDTFEFYVKDDEDVEADFIDKIEKFLEKGWK